MNEKTEKSYEGLKQTYIEIFKLSLEASNIKSAEDIQKMVEINAKKEVFIKTVIRLRASVVLNEKQKTDIENLIEKIKALEAKNIERVIKMKDEVAQDLASLNKSISLAGAYKAKNEVKSRLIDASE